MKCAQYVISVEKKTFYVKIVTNNVSTPPTRIEKCSSGSISKIIDPLKMKQKYQCSHHL